MKTIGASNKQKQKTPVFGERGALATSCCDFEGNIEVISANIWHSTLSENSTSKRVFSKSSICSAI